MLTDVDRRVDGSTGVIELAHQKGLLVHTWTFRGDSAGYDFGFKDVKSEIEYHIKLGIDGVFSDFPAAGVAALKSVRGNLNQPLSEATKLSRARCHRGWHQRGCIRSRSSHPSQTRR